MAFSTGLVHRRSSLTKLSLLIVTLLILQASALGEQKYVSRYDVFTGYTFLDSPHVSLFENGFHTQAGIRLRRWYSLGLDYSVSSGNLTLAPDLLTTKLQQQLGALFAGLAAAGQLPAGYSLVVPTHSLTQTFTGGPQFSYRHFSKFTLFVRPSVGGIHELGTPKPGDPIATLVVSQLAPSGKKKDTTYFYGFGGGVDLLFSKHVGLRVQADLVRDHLFDDLLRDARFTTRFSIGPCFNFGRNLPK